MNISGRQPVQKPAACVSEPLRKAAKGQPCTLRLPCCNGDSDTTVLAHLRMFGWAGTAQKPRDVLAVFACSACHDALDKRDPETAWLCGFEDILRALGETLMRQQDMGNIIVRGAK